MNMNKLQLVILAGGLGTRLREETEFRPKPMVEIGGKPILWHIMKYYSTWGVCEFIICTGYKGEMIKDYFLNYGADQYDLTIDRSDKKVTQIGTSNVENWKVTVVDTGALTPTGGRISQIQKYITQDEFLCTYGDGVANVDISELVNLHRNNNSIATLTAVKPLSRFGVLDILSDGKVEKFREKPRMETWINGGYFVFNREIFKLLNLETTLELEPLSALAASGNLSAYRHDGFWQSMDTLREAQILNKLWSADEAEWKIW
jgi:glucose-1-phosphate cytidylyltransferase